MADLNKKDSSQTISIVGADSAGVETNYVNADVNGRLLVSTENSESPTFTVLASNIALANNKSLLSLVNLSPNSVSLREVWMSLYNTRNFPNDDVEFGLFRITGHLLGNLVITSPHDTNDTLHTDITVRSGAIVTGEGAVPIESHWWASEDAERDKDGIVENAMAKHFPLWDQTPGIKPIIIRPGQGIHLKSIGIATGASFIVRFVFTT